MTHITKTFVLLFLLAVLLSCRAVHDPVEVMTFNIRYENPNDGMFSWDSRKEMVFWLIEKYDPDILGLQEAMKGQLDNLEASLSEYAWFGAGRDDGEEKGEYVPVFYKKDRFTAVDHGNFWLSDNPGKPGSIGWDAVCSRMVSWIRLEEIDGGQGYFVFNTHFDHVGEKARRQSALMLADSIENIAGSNPVIITGDFNCVPDSPPLLALTELFEDARMEAEMKDEGSGTTYVGFPADMFLGKIIDHIFVSRHFKVNAHEIISDNTNGFFPSDHLPVRVRLELKN